MNGIIAGIIRALLALFAGTVGTTDADIGASVNVFIDGLVSGNSNQIGSALLTLGVILWSVYDKKKKEKIDEKSVS